MRKIFIADAHLRNPEDENYRKLICFLKELKGNTDTLYILGDLFEFWIGFPGDPFPHYQPMLEQLRQLVSAGTELVFFEGNHDFHMGPFFRDTLNARIYRGPASVNIGEKLVYLCHGDQINRSDKGYLMLRFMLHHNITRAIVPVFPVKIATFIAGWMGRQSKKGHGKRRAKWDYPAILRNFAAARFAEGYDAVISGHFHLPLFEQPIISGERTLLSLGDWIHHFSYGEWDAGKFSLKIYASNRAR